MPSGVLGAKVFPAVRVTLISDSLTFNVHDNGSGQDLLVSNSGDTLPLFVRAKDHSSSFSISDPKYVLSFLVTPGIDARLMWTLRCGHTIGTSKFGSRNWRSKSRRAG